MESIRGIWDTLCGRWKIACFIPKADIGGLILTIQNALSSRKASVHDLSELVGYIGAKDRV